MGIKNINQKKLPTLHLVIGLPYISFMDSYVNTLKDELDATVLSVMDLQMTFDDPTCAEHDSLLSTLYEKTAFALSNGQSVIISDNVIFLKMKKRKSLLNYLISIPCYKVCTLFVDPLDLTLTSNTIADSITRNAACKFNPPMMCEGWSNIQLHYSDLYTNFSFHSLDSDDLMKFNQKTEHHSLTLGQHMIKTSEIVKDYIKDLNEQVVLSEAAKWHDIGKFYTQSFNKNNHNAHYHNHENIGAYIYLNHCNNIYLDDLKNKKYLVDYNDYSLYVSSLICWHMRGFEYDMNRKLMSKDIANFGVQFVTDISLLHYADSHACN